MIAPDKKTSDIRIAVFLSSDPFVRDLFGISAKFKIGKTLLLVSGYTQPILYHLIALRPNLIILHKPTKRLINLIMAAKNAALLTETIIQIQPEMTETLLRPPAVVQVRNTGLTERENQIVRGTIAGESTRALAHSMGMGEATIRAERAKLKQDILLIKELIAKLDEPTSQRGNEATRQRGNEAISNGYDSPVKTSL